MIKNLTYLFLTTLVIFQSHNIFSQDDERCATMEALQERIDNDPKYAAYYEWAHSISEEERVGQIPCDGNNTIVVPVAFHFAPGVVTCGDSDCLLAEVEDQLEAMNIAYGDNTAASSAMVAACPAAYEDGAGNSVVSTGTCISFCLAVPPENNAQGLDPACDPPITIGEFTGGFGAGGNGAPGWTGILNLFIVTDANCLGVADGIPGAGNGDGVSTCASAFGGFDPSSGCGLDDEGTYNLGATMVHEIGHYLGLYHTFQGGCGDEPAGPGPFSVTDTPPASAPYFGCNMATCEASSCGGGVQGIANFMDYTDDACMTMFTEDQAAVQNYWANQLFGTSNAVCSAPSPTELPNACLNQPCVLVCPAVVTTPYSGAEEICTIAGDYTLPTDFSSVVLDDDSDAVYSWSTGGYLSAGGVAIAGTTYTPAPPSCAAVDETLYLNVDCGTDPLATTLDAGTLVLTVYPDPSTFAVTDLVTFTDGVCDSPTWVVTPGCEAFVTVTQNGGPTFPVAAGDIGTVNYDVTLNYPVACCCPATPATQTETNTTVVDIPDGDLANPGCTTVTIPAGGSITDVILDLDITHTWVGDLTITLTSPAGTTITLGEQPGVPTSGFGCNGDNISVTFDDAAVLTATDFENACANAPAISGPYQPVDLLATFDGEDAAGVWTICVSDAVNADTGSITNFSLTVESLAPCMDPAGCTLAGTADYNCADCSDCADPMCITTIACDDMDCNTETDMTTVLVSDNSVCVPCAGTPIPPPDCDDTDCNTADSYDALTCTCINDPIPPPDCDDADCNTADSYDAATCTCVNDPIPPPDCDDMDCTTDDSYDAVNCVCINTPIPPPDCDDSDCNTADSYDTATCMCVNDPIPPPDCDDMDCNTADVYNTTTCMCENNPITPDACDDNDCNTDDSYDMTTCMCVNDPIPPPDCDDGCAVTDDSYDSATCTCANTPNCAAGETYDAANCQCISQTCEDAITGTVFTDDAMCPPPGSDFAGISVTIIDAATGMPVAGSPVLTDAMGNYNLAGPFPCGQYTAELDPATLPVCYASLDGEVGPLPFSINGDGTADGADFSNILMIPTLSQWGLIILALLLMSFGAVKITTLRKVKITG